MLPSDFSIVFQPPMVVGQRPRAVQAPCSQSSRGGCIDRLICSLTTSGGET
jgi:hypothetical protein